MNQQITWSNNHIHYCIDIEINYTLQTTTNLMCIIIEYYTTHICYLI